MTRPLIFVLALFLGFSAVEAVTSARKVAQASTSLQDTVKKLRVDDEGVVVLFVNAKGSYYLRRELAQFESFKKKLEESLKEKKPVNLEADPSNLYILNVK